MRTIVFAIMFILFMIATLPFFIPYLLLLPFRKPRERLVGLATTLWAKYSLWLAGVKVEVKGRENLPVQGQPGVCYISNHQGYGDIFVILASVPGTVGFVAKKEILPFPIISWWMLTMHCLFMDRKSMRKSMKTIEKGIDYLKKGYPMLIFPEGTRSRSDKMGSFKAGSFKLATRSRASIYPLTVQGTYHMMEERGGIHPAQVTLTVHPPISPEVYTEWDKQTLITQLEGTISAPLPDTALPK